MLGFLAGSTFRSLTYLRRGALAEAEADGFATLEMARELGLLFTIPFIAGYLALTLNERGRSEDAAALLESIPLPCASRHASRDHVVGGARARTSRSWKDRRGDRGSARLWRGMRGA